MRKIVFILMILILFTIDNFGQNNLSISKSEIKRIEKEHSRLSNDELRFADSVLINLIDTLSKKVFNDILETPITINDSTFLLDTSSIQNIHKTKVLILFVDSTRIVMTDYEMELSQEQSYELEFATMNMQLLINLNHKAPNNFIDFYKYMFDIELISGEILSVMYVLRYDFEEKSYFIEKKKIEYQ